MSALSFAEKFRAECIDGSAISPELYNTAVEFVEDTGRWEPNRTLNHHVSTFWQTRAPHSYNSIALFKQEGGEVWQAKAENPRTDKDGKLVKYESNMSIERGHRCGHICRPLTELPGGRSASAMAARCRHQGKASGIG
jgi:hypothetical protein